ncbi:hypothetical protein CC2G_001157 [Coprinopsis cinerea AmutBmut pab1-1]|nr:hypothetical protein CC2G_001157 [Coprinopsis cinerea AmutBmut pab1-1]
MNQYPGYGYYGQPMHHQQYPHQPGPMQMQPGIQPGPHGYPPFYPPHPSQQIPPGQGPMPVPSYDAEAYTNPQSIPSSSNHLRKSKRASAPAASASQPQPLKSAMKQPKVTATPVVSSMEFPQAAYSGYPLTRPRTNSVGHHNGDARRRANSNAPSYHDHSGIDPPFQAVHMFISFHGQNEIRLENVTELAMKELREKIWCLWPDGADAQMLSPDECVVRFRNQPWDISGPNYLTAIRMLQELFTLCCRRGYVFQTAINTGHQQVPRLIFQVENPDLSSQFFLAYFSSSGRRLTIINAPSNVELGLNAQLKAALPRKIDTQPVMHPGSTDNIRYYEIKRGVNPSVAPSVFLAHILKILTTLGFELNFSIALQKRQSLGLRSTTQEVLVFKGAPISG